MLEAYRLIKTSMLKVDHSDVPLDGLLDGLDEGAEGVRDDDADMLLGVQREEDAEAAAAAAAAADEEAEDGAAGDSLLHTPSKRAAAAKTAAAAASAARSASRIRGEGSPSASSSATKAAAAAPVRPTTTHTRITEEAFHKMTMSIALRMREAEEAAGEAGDSLAAGGDDEERLLAQAVRVDQLLDRWVEDSGARGEEEAAAERTLALKVVRKLLRPDEGVLYYATPGEAAKTEVDRYVNLNPEFVLTGVD